METTNIIAILLFIVPGVIAEKVSNRMDIPSNRKLTSFGEIVNGILWSIPIVATVGSFICYKYKLSTIQQAVKAFNSLSFIIVFSTITITAALIIGTLKGLCKDKLIDIVNFIRVKIFNKIAIDDKSCWRKMFLDKNKHRYLEVIFNGQTYKGFAECYSLPNEEKEIVIYNPKEWEHYPEIEKKFKKVDNIYINIEKSIVIKNYDTKDYDEYCTNLNEKSNVETNSSKIIF